MTARQVDFNRVFEILDQPSMRWFRLQGNEPLSVEWESAMRTIVEMMYWVELLGSSTMQLKTKGYSPFMGDSRIIQRIASDTTLTEDTIRRMLLEDSELRLVVEDSTYATEI